MGDIIDLSWDLNHAAEEKILSGSIDSVARLIFLRLIIRAYEKDPQLKMIEFLFRYDNIPLSFEKKISVFREFSDEGIVEIKSFKSVLKELSADKTDYETAHHFLLTKRSPLFDVREHILNLRILKGKIEVEAQYEKEIESFTLDVKQFSLLKQREILLQYLFDKKKFLGKNTMLFSYDDIYDDSKNYINLFYVLLYLEYEEELKILVINSASVFHIELASHRFRGRNFLIDMRACSIKYNDGTDVPIRPNTKFYKALNVLVSRQNDKISDTDFSFALSGKQEMKESLVLAKAYAKAARRDIRGRNLECVEGDTRDIFLVDDGHTSLRV